MRGSLGGRGDGWPSDLVRHDLVMSLGPLPDRRIVEIVDDIWLPLMR